MTAFSSTEQALVGTGFIPGLTPANASLVNCHIQIRQRRAAEQASA